MKQIVVIGGGITGSSTAYHLARAGAADQVTVVEPDPTYENAATPRSLGGIRVLFSIPENIRMSLYGHEIYGNFPSLMAVEGEPAPIDFRPYGYLIMTEQAEEARMLAEIREVQLAEGAEVELLDAAAVTQRVPSLNVDDLRAALFTPGDGFVDPHAALMGFRRKAVSLGVTYLRDRVVDLVLDGRLVRSAGLASGKRLATDAVVNAANCWAPEICSWLGMKVPVEPMRRMVFYFECATKLETMPLVRYIEKGGSFRTEGTGYLTGISNYDEPRGFNWDVDYRLFDEVLWPLLAERVPAFETIKMRRAWACHYDQNALDANLIIGGWPGRLENFYIACGLSGHGLQHAPAVGRALAELIVDGGYQTLDLSCFGYQRILEDKPLLERGMIS